MRNFFRFTRPVVFTPIFLLVFMLSNLMAADQKTELFQKAAEAFNAAKTAQASIYSPEHYKDGVKFLKDAEEAFQTAKSRTEIQENLDKSVKFFIMAVEVTKMAQMHLGDCISAREDALEAEAPEFRTELWEDAEKALNSAAKTLENGNLKSAKNKSQKAEELFRKAELESIKANYLDTTRELLEKAKKEGVHKRAAITIEKATELADRSEKLLIQNRYDTDEARQIAQEAKYEANHAFFLSNYIQEAEKNNQTTEMLVFDAEKAIQTIADNYDAKAYFDNGYGGAVSKLSEIISNQQMQMASLKREVESKNEQINALNMQIALLENKLGDLDDLTQMIEAQKAEREKYGKVRDSFKPEEAEVVKVSDKIIVRLYGLAFPSGKSIIQSEYFGLLGKVVDVFKTYPNAGITVEGHTDSRGGDAINQKLSTERAEAVREYLLSVSDVGQDRILAVGHGEAKPVASNETQKGREKNRRIEVVIHPEK